jgi:hypothetical protein
MERYLDRLTGGAEDAERYYRAAGALAVDVSRDIPSTTAYRIATAAREGVWPPDLLAIVRADVDGNREALALVDRAAALPFERFGPGTSYDAQMSELYKLARLCDWRAVVRVADGDGDGAVASLYSQARLARALRWPPPFRILAFVLEHGHPSAAARARLADALVPLDRDDGLQQEFLRMRATLVDEHRFDRAAWSSPMRTFRMHRRVELLDQYTAVARAAARPWPEPLQAVPALGVVSPKNRMRTTDRTVLEAMAKGRAQMMRSIRCARFHVSSEPLKLVDPFTGRFLELVDCKL